MNRFLERLEQGPVICAEGYLFEFERRGYLQAGAYVPEVVLEHPELVAHLARARRSARAAETSRLAPMAPRSCSSTRSSWRSCTASSCTQARTSSRRSPITRIAR